MIKIKKSKTADSRYCNFSKIPKKTLLESSQRHIEDVRKGLDYFSDKLKQAAEVHDNTKISNIDEFYKDFKTGFKTSEWYDKIHKVKERHHIFDNPPKDVDLVDVLECIVDCVMAAKGRSSDGFIKRSLPEGLLQKAFDNTIFKFLKEVEVVE